MSRTLPRPPKVVDLHADSIANFEDYDNDELLGLSLEKLRDNLDAAIYWEYTQIEFIHGRGKGILRDTVYEELRYYKESGSISSYHPSYRNSDIVVVHIGL
ncbi:Smr/MutS family protein [Sphingobacterium faecale]|uniref:Smr/MutS family protein n=1 Tax=Sphingobacterium faecale TaxID=2803775 RepID=A0ABS1R7V2_9SPHI|nr:Smr/MutS family protein [Sphingobacterium faecale]MBL1409916.1 Smr/MutS family protein [Sphingobacterium faecale]